MEGEIIAACVFSSCFFWKENKGDLCDDFLFKNKHRGRCYSGVIKTGDCGTNVFLFNSLMHNGNFSSRSTQCYSYENNILEQALLIGY